MSLRELGKQGLEVSELGLGCMGMSDFYLRALEVCLTPEDMEAINSIAQPRPGLRYRKSMMPMVNR